MRGFIRVNIHGGSTTILPGFLQLEKITGVYIKHDLDTDKIFTFVMLSGPNDIIRVIESIEEIQKRIIKAQIDMDELDADDDVIFGLEKEALTDELEKRIFFSTPPGQSGPV